MRVVVEAAAVNVGVVKQQQPTMVVRALGRVGATCGVLSSMLSAHAARRAGLGPVSALALAAVNGVGGSTLRDMLLGRRVSWVTCPRPLYMSVAAGAVGYYALDRIKRVAGLHKRRALAQPIFDLALGAAAFSGVADARSASPSRRADLLVSSALGLLTAMGGGALCDVALGGGAQVLKNKGSSVAAPLLLSVGALVVAERLQWPRSSDGRALLACAVALAAKNRRAVAQWARNTAAQAWKFVSASNNKKHKKGILFFRR